MSKKKINDYSAFLSILAKQAGNLSDSDIKRVLLKELDIKITLVELKPDNVKNNLMPEVDVDAVLGKLNSLGDRDNAKSELSNMTKKHLEVIARALDIAVQKSDKVDTLRHKIVEATVGARLRSSAIQGTQT